jgi:hypothetical protein
MTHPQVLETFIKQVYASCSYPGHVDIAKEIKTNKINNPTQYTYAPYVSFDDDREWGSLDITYECELTGNPEDLFKNTADHWKAVAELTANALRMSELNSLTITNLPKPSDVVFNLRLNSNIYLEVTKSGQYELFERNWNSHKPLKKVSFKKAPTVTQLKDFKKKMFSSCLASAKRELERTIDTLNDYNMIYKREKAQLEYVESLLS